MERRPILSLLATLAALLAPAGISLAQHDAEPPPENAPQQSELATPPVEPSVFADAPIDADISRLTSMLEGSWKTTEPVGQGEDGDARVLWMHMLPFETKLLGRAIYVEMHADGTPWEPTRQAIYRVYRYGDTLRLRTYEFREPHRADVLANLWLAPDAMPLDELRPDELIPTRDLEFTRASGGYEGQTARPYPSANGGSVEMTSSLRARPDRLVTRDAYYGLDGSALPGPGEVAWERGTLPATVEVGDDGLVVITLEEGKTGGPPTDEGDIVFLNYEVWRTDGTVFDSTWERGLALRTMYPLRVVGGFKKGIEPLVEGMRRKLIIPPALGFGDVEMQNMPGGSTLVFHIKVIRVEQSDPVPMEVRKKRMEQP